MPLPRSIDPSSLTEFATLTPCGPIYFRRFLADETLSYFATYNLRLLQYFGIKLTRHKFIVTIIALTYGK